MISIWTLSLSFLSFQQESGFASSASLVSSNFVTQQSYLSGFYVCDINQVAINGVIFNKWKRNRNSRTLLSTSFAIKGSDFSARKTYRISKTNNSRSSIQRHRSRRKPWITCWTKWWASSSKNTKNRYASFNKIESLVPVRNRKYTASKIIYRFQKASMITRNSLSTST